jgi:hypothetical protein
MRSLILSLLALGILSMWVGNHADELTIKLWHKRTPNLGFNLFFGGLLIIGVTLFGGTLWALING